MFIFTPYMIGIPELTLKVAAEIVLALKMLPGS
jgi:hypothetical protein